MLSEFWQLPGSTNLDKADEQDLNMMRSASCKAMFTAENSILHLIQSSGL